MHLRHACLACLLIAALPLGAATVVMDNLYGRWEPDIAAVDWSTVKLDGDPAAAKAALIAQWKAYAVVFTPRLFRAETGGEPMRGKWRLDGATDNAATVVVLSSEGGQEFHRPLRLVAGKVFFDDLPWKLPFKKVTGQ